MKNRFWTITAKSNSEIEILLYEMIGQDFWTGEGTTAKSFAEDLKAAGGGIRKIHLRVNSPGGSVFDGLAIYNTLLGHGARVTATVDGLAASIASVIVMAASEISMGDNAMLMIHNPSTLITGDSNEMRKMADTMDKVKSSMITAYRRHSSLSVENIGALMDAETWMTATEAVDKYGFAEEVIEPSEDDDDLAAAVRTPIFARFRRVPPRIAQIAARYAPRDDDDDERRRRTLRLRTLELHENAGSRVARPHPEDAGTRTRGRCSDASHLRRSATAPHYGESRSGATRMAPERAGRAGRGLGG